MTDIEDILLNNKKYTINVLDKENAKKIITELIERNINSKVQYQKFKQLMWKKLKLSSGFGDSHLLSRYRELVDEKVFSFDEKIVNIIAKKKVRQKYGVMVVAQTLSPYPEIDLKNNPKLYKELIQDEEDQQKIGGRFTCAWNCTFCPSRPGMPKSYDERESGIRRGMLAGFDPIEMMNSRLNTFVANGSDPDKIEMIYLGGTFESFFGKLRDDEEYVEWFTRMSYYACNVFNDDIKREPLSLKEERYINRFKKPRIIGFTIETRPDQVVKSLPYYRDLGCTRIQLGIQHIGTEISDRVLDRVERACTTKQNKDAMKCCLQNNQKIDIHIMTDLPKPFHEKRKYIGTPTYWDVDWEVDTVLTDLEMCHSIFFDPTIRYDQIKIYPCQVVEYSILFDEFKNELHIPYSDKFYTASEINKMYNYSQYPFINNWIEISNREYISKDEFFQNFYSFMHEYIVKETAYELGKKNSSPTFNIFYILIIYVKIHTRQWIRINRAVRDIPTDTVVGGVRDQNARQIIHNIMKRNDWYCPCIRCRTAEKNCVKDTNLIKQRVIEYKSFEGTEYFIEYIYDIQPYPKCIGFVRLRLDKNAGLSHKGKVIFPELLNCAMIRELHVYGEAIPKGKDIESTQHKGFGQKLVNAAILIAQNNGYEKISVIAGDGVKLYYQNKFNFYEEGHFMIKNINVRLKNNYYHKKSYVSKIINMFLSLTFIILLFSYLLFKILS